MDRNIIVRCMFIGGSLDGGQQDMNNLFNALVVNNSQILDAVGGNAQPQEVYVLNRAQRCTENVPTEELQPGVDYYIAEFVLQV